MEKKTRGELGFWRRFTGTWTGMLTAVSLFLTGFTFYEIEDWRILLVGAILCIVLLIAGIGKDLVEIIKNKTK